MSNLVSCALLAPLLSCSTLISWRTGSTSTSLSTVLRSSASRSLSLLCHCMTGKSASFANHGVVGRKDSPAYIRGGKSIPGSRSRVHFLRQVTTPLVEHITSQIHRLSDESLVKSAQNAVRCERLEELKERAERIRVRAPPKTKRTLDLTAEEVSSV